MCRGLSALQRIFDRRTEAPVARDGHAGLSVDQRGCPQGCSGETEAPTVRDRRRRGMVDAEKVRTDRAQYVSDRVLVVLEVLGGPAVTGQGHPGTIRGSVRFACLRCEPAYMARAFRKVRSPAFSYIWW